MFQNKKLTRRLLYFFAAVLLFSGIATGFLYHYTNRSLPVSSGQLVIPGLKEKVTVSRDEKGVPHVYAENEQDLYIAQGYVQAQDRLFQMDLSRRQASGTLSEAVGEAAVDRDKFFRTLGLRRAAEKSYQNYEHNSKKVLQWFADGVNAFIQDASQKGSLPPEFTVLGYQPQPWTPVDSLTIGKYMAFDLGGHWSGQAFRYWALQTFPKEKAMELFPSYPKDAPHILESYQQAKLDLEDSFTSAVIPPEHNGSNNWVLSGSKSASGKPLLADDPHLSLGTPSIWYQMHLATDALNVSGVIFAGIPGIILGHNKHIAWGVTNTGPDVQDLYIEKRHPNDPHVFLYNEKWEKANVIEEPIRVKNGTAIPYEVIETRHGPIISEFAHDQKKRTALSMKWTALQPSAELQAILNMNKAQNWNEFEKALEDFHVPAQNFVFADIHGNIAYKANGKIPIRKKGDGMLPVPGWTDEYEWEGFIPYEKLPKSVNPEKGYIATANNKVVSDSYPYHISHHWAQPYRYMRIAEFLEEKETYTLDDMQNLQMDIKNLYAKEFLPRFLMKLQALPLTEIEEAALRELTNWDGQDDKNSPAPLIFHLWMKQIADVLFKDSIPKKMDKLFEGKQSITDELLRRSFSEKDPVWIKEKGGINKVLAVSFHQTINKLDEQYGNDPATWKWGHYHQLDFPHPLSSASGLLKSILNPVKPTPLGGSQITVMAANYGQDGIVRHGASWRFTIDMADSSKGHHIVGPGQSGHFRSRWYHDQYQDWVQGTYHITDLDKKPQQPNILYLVPGS
ncbi:penicillin acylase family protein [Bacillus lacus]|uniref:Penicillin acylase family protein n=1 Tax=Metabacillus lacus TaxID=1983721 RepID=A0A7X2IZA7_9BACI|nr:penicillin acylase family protein [Metabacillus lacus]MRX72445.1 penicillin acylase family protein [Metabacillus lacus]